MGRQEILDQLLDRWQRERAAGHAVRLEELCENYPELIDEVQRCIDALEQLEPDHLRLPFSLYDSDTVANPAGVSVLPAFESFPTFPGYEILEEIGQGGMGIVYKARQLSLNRLVALKVIRRGADAGDEERRRFRQEAEVIAALGHPGIVQVHEIGEHQGHLFVSLEYIDGGNLAQELLKQPLPARQAAELIEHIARTIHVAHSRGIIHRDLKPANVLLVKNESPQSSQRESANRANTDRVSASSSTGGVAASAGATTLIAKITDFGLARRMDDDLHSTQHGAILGTPAYMAPEQTGGPSREVSPSLDIYALGVILYECLTGQVPFRAASMMELFELIRTREPVSLRRLNPNIPRDLETICLKCLHKSPARRYAGALELAEDLQRFLCGEPILARPISHVERALRWCARNRALAALSFLSVATLMAFIVLGFWISARIGAMRAERESTKVRIEAAQTRAEAAEQLAASRQFFGLFTQARERIARSRPGWTWRALADLEKLTTLEDAKSKGMELRADIVRCLGAVDVRMKQSVGRKIKAHSIAWHPTKRVIALGERAVNVLTPWVNVYLIDLDQPAKWTTLSVLQKRTWNQKKALVPDICHSLTFSPDGNRLMVGMRSGFVHLWDLTSEKRPPLTLKGHDLSVDNLLVSPDSKTAYSASRDRLYHWDLSTGKSLAFATPPNSTKLLTRSAAGHILLIDGSDGLIHLDGITLKQLQRSTLPFNPVAALSASDGRTLLLTDGGELTLWDSQENRVCGKLLPMYEDLDQTVRFSMMGVNADGTLAVCCSENRQQIRLWDLVARRLVAELPSGGGAGRVTFDPTGSVFAVTAEGRTDLYEINPRYEHTVECGQPDGIHNVALAGKTLVYLTGSSKAAVTDLHMRRWNNETWSPPRTVRLKMNPALASTLSVGPEDYIALSQKGRGVGLWIHRLTTDLPGVQVTPTGMSSLTWGADGRLWAVGANELRAWTLQSMNVSARWKNTHGAMVRGRDDLRGIAVGKKWVATISDDGYVRFLRVGTGELSVHSGVQLPRFALRGLAMSPDESAVVVGSDTGEIWLVAIPSAKILATLPGNGDQVESIDWSCHNLLAVANRDGIVRLVRVKQKQLEEVLQLPHERGIRKTQFFPDGRRLVVLPAGQSGLHIWHLDRLQKRLEKLRLGEPRLLPMDWE